MVQVNATRFATEKRIFFVVYKAGFEESRETALASVVHEHLKQSHSSASHSQVKEKPH